MAETGAVLRLEEPTGMTISTYTIGTVFGALITTYLFSRLLFWFVKSWDGGTRKTILVHAMSLIICALLGGMSFATNGTYAGAYAIGVYVVPQLIWLGVDLLRQRRRKTVQ